MDGDTKLNIILIMLAVILVVMLYIFIKSSSMLTQADLQLSRAEYIGKMLLRGCNGTQI